ncbi:MAG: response regulator transcription factor [Gemmatimonadaceae bacterium]
MLLVEEHAIMRAALRALLSVTPGLSVVAEARTLSVAPELARLCRPDVVLVDGRALAASDGGGLHELRRAAPEACVLVLSDDAPEAAREANHAYGAHGCLAKDADVDVLCATVESVLGARCANCVLRSSCPVPQIAVALSRRERQVAVRIAQGLTSKQIAAALGISLRTVHTYRESLARKLGASSAAVVTRFVLKVGLTDASPSGAAAGEPAAPAFR